MKRVKYIIILCLLCLFLSSCNNSLSECKIVDKTYKPGYITLIPIYNGNNVMLIPQYHPDSWYITIEGKDDKGEVHQRLIQVDETTYHNSNIGQEWNET